MHAKHMIGLAIAGLFAEADEADTQGGAAIPAQNSAPGKINATYLQNHFLETSGAETTRLAVLIATLNASTAKEVAQAVRDWSNSHAPSKDLVAKAKSGDAEAAKQVAEQTAKRQVVQTRGGEVKVLKAAMDTGFQPQRGKGYHPTVASARAILAEKGLGTNGRPKVDRQTRDQRRKAVQVAAKALELAKNDVSKVGDLIEEAQAATQKETARKLAAVVLQRHGAEMAVLVAEALHTLIDEQQRAAHDAEARRQAEEGNTQQSQETQQQAETIPQAAAA